MDKLNVKWGRILEKGEALRVIVEPNRVRIQLGHAGPPTDETCDWTFVLDAEIPLGVPLAYEFGSAIGSAAFDADKKTRRGRKNSLASRDAQGWRK